MLPVQSFADESLFEDGNKGKGSPNKRKNSSNDGGPQSRSKRTRYTSIACNECKRRKIKCNGESPCQRCGNMNLECVYAPNCCTSFKDSNEYKQMEAHIAQLQEQVDMLTHSLNALRHHVENNVGAIDPSLYAPQPSYAPAVPLSQASGSAASPESLRPRTTPMHPSFQGPTSAAFSLGVAKTTLQTMGISAPEESIDEALTAHESPVDSPSMSNQLLGKAPLHATKDQIWAISREEAIRLCRVWQDDCGVMYPVLNMERVIQHANQLYTFMEAGVRHGVVQLSLPGADALHDEMTIILKVIIATALILEGSGKSDLGQRIFDQANVYVNEQILGKPGIKGIQMLSLAAMYQFHRDDESQAWRLTGVCARLCMELGLHRRETYDTHFTDPDERAATIKLFWSVYVLDRRWSLGTGMPFAFQDADIDPQLPIPDDDVPYLNAMITYSKIGSRVWAGVVNYNDDWHSVDNGKLQNLDYQVINWVRNLPPSLQFHHPEGEQSAEPLTRNNDRLRLLLYLRANQMRILIYRPVLHSATSIMENLQHAHTVVDIAKDSIKMLMQINQTTDYYRTHQILFNYFLLSALAVLFLAVSHAPARFSEDCRIEFYTALDLVRGLSATSYVSKRLWKTIKNLKEIGPKLGLNINQPAAVDAHSSAAVAMAGLAGHQIDEVVFAKGSNGNLGREGSANSDSPNGIANAMATLYEAAGHLSNIMPNNGYGMPPATGDLASGGEGGQGHEEELARILKDLF